MFTTTKTVRVLGFAVVASALGLLQACSPTGSEQVNGEEVGVVAQAAMVAGNSHVMAPVGYVAKFSTCTHYVESADAIRNNSRIVNIAADGTVPIQRVEASTTDSKDNFRRLRVGKLTKPLKGGTGYDRQLGTKVKFVKLGQIVQTKEADGSIVQWVIGSERLGEPVRSKTGRLEYNDHCFRNPAIVGKDTAGRLSAEVELAVSCVVEENNMPWNALSSVTFTPLVNFSDATDVGTANNPAVTPHPDEARYDGYDGAAHLYSGIGAALNDINGTERDETTAYLAGESYCHMIVSGGLEVPGAKRPATRSLPAPGIVYVKSLVIWRPVNPNVIIANAKVASVPDPIEPDPAPVEEVVAAADATVPM